MSSSSSNETVFVDASGHIAGRLSSILASQLISGKRIVVLNAEKALVSGNKESVFREWQKRLELASKVNPLYGPIHPRRPDNIMRRMVRGMVPKTRAKGVDALHRLRIYMGTPEKYSGKKLIKFDKALATRPEPLYVTLADVSKSVGWNGS